MVFPFVAGTKREGEKRQLMFIEHWECPVPCRHFKNKSALEQGFVCIAAFNPHPLTFEVGTVIAPTL